METFDRIFKAANRCIANIEKGDSIYTCTIQGDKTFLITEAPFIGDSMISLEDDVIKAFHDAVLIIPQYNPTLELRARTDVLLRLARNLGYFSFAAENGGVFISAAMNGERDIEVDYRQLGALSRQYLGCDINLSRTPPQEVLPLLHSRIEQAHAYYVEKHGSWTEEFLAGLGDDVSRISFICFLRQRIMAAIFDDSAICYPVLPPSGTAAWRKEREARSYDFPSLKGHDQNLLHTIFYKYIFVYEQYAVPGAVEAQPGDTVIDAGAFIGDTAYYFSRKVGPTGKVFSFEISPESVAHARENMKDNGCNNVEVISCALSDEKGRVNLSMNRLDPSSHAVATPEEALLSVTVADTITLDEFCEQHGVRVDFIKADIEGSEMQMLHGAAKTITRDAPVCAICLYHKQEDYWQIPQFLKELRPDYTFWFRCESEPVLYAKKNNKGTEKA